MRRNGIDTMGKIDKACCVVVLAILVIPMVIVVTVLTTIDVLVDAISEIWYVIKRP